MDLTERRIEYWKQKLVDLSKRNKLLYFQSPGKSSLEIINPPIEKIFTRLVAEEKHFEFYVPEPSHELVTASANATSVETFLAQEEQQVAKPSMIRPARADELMANGANHDQNLLILRNLFRRSTAEYEDRGVRVLHLAFGLLEWREKEGSDLYTSPLVLLPVCLKRKAVNAPFELEPTAEELVLNPALQVKLNNDFKFELAGLPEDWERTPLELYLSEIESNVATRGWKVKRECWLGMFSFHKLVMYQDLVSRSDLIKNHPVVKGLAGEISQEVKDALSGELEHVDRLDSIIDPRQSHLVVEADSSQLACMEAANRGLNFVIHGPPGTGKSQTITNLISESIAKGKSVLFVSEKMAALEVVHKRLQAAQLGHFCLELHSQNANKRQLVQELTKCYQEKLEASDDLSSQEFQRLLSRKNRLNDYVLALHLNRSPLGRSAFEVLGEMASLHEIPVISDFRLDIENITPEFIETINDLTQRLSRVWSVAKDADGFVWAGFSATKFGAELRAKLLSIISNCQYTLSDLVKHAEVAAMELGLEAPSNLLAAGVIQQISAMMASPPRLGLALLGVDELDSFDVAAEYKERKARERIDLRKSLSHSYKDTIFLWDESALLKLTSSLREILFHFPLFPKADKQLEKHLLSISSWARTSKKFFKYCIALSFELSEKFGLEKANCVIDLKEKVTFVRTCFSAHRPEHDWFNNNHFDKQMAALTDLRIAIQRRSPLRNRILTYYHEEFLIVAEKFSAIPSLHVTFQNLVASEPGALEMASDRAVEKLTGMLVRSINKLLSMGQELSERLALRAPSTLPEFQDFLKLLLLTRSSVKPLPAWLTTMAPSAVRGVTVELRTKIQSRNNYIEKLSGVFDESYIRWKGDLEKVWIDLDEVRLLLQHPVGKRSELMIIIEKLDPLFSAFQSRTTQIMHDATRVAAELRLPKPMTVKEVERFLNVLSLIESNDQACVSWKEPNNRNQARRVLKELESHICEHKMAHNAVSSEFEPSVKKLEVSRMIDALKVQYDSPLRWVKPGYYELRKRIKSHRRDGVLPDNLVASLRMVQDLIELEERRVELFELLDQQIGHFNLGAETEILRVHECIQFVEELERLGATAQDGFVELAMKSKNPMLERKPLISRLHEAISDWNSLHRKICTIIQLERLPSDGLPLSESDLTSISEWLDSVRHSFASSLALLDNARKSLRPNKSNEVEALHSSFELLRELLSIEALNETNESRYSEILGDWYHGFDTDVDAADQAIQIAEDISALFGRRVPASVVALFSPEPLNEVVDLESIDLLQAEMQSIVSGVTTAKNRLRKGSVFQVFSNADQHTLLQLGKQCHQITEVLTGLGEFVHATRILMRSSEPRPVADMIADLRAAYQLADLEAQSLCHFPEYEKSLGRWFKGFDTNLAGAEQALNLVTLVKNKLGEQVPAKFVDALCGERVINHELIDSVERFSASLDEFKNVADDCPVDVANPASMNKQLLEAEFDTAEEYLNAINTTLGQLLDGLDELKSKRWEEALGAFSNVERCFEELIRLKRVEVDLLLDSGNWAKCFPSDFNHLDTDWASVRKSIKWLKGLKKIVGQLQLPETLCHIIAEGRNTNCDADGIAKCIMRFEENARGLQAQFNDKPTQSKNNLADTTSTFSAWSKYLDLLLAEIDSLSDWIDFTNIKEEFARRDLGRLLEGLAQLSVDEAIVQAVVNKTVLCSWLDQVFESDNSLGQFRGQNHDNLIADFRELDRRLISFGPARVINALNSGRNLPPNEPGGEVATLLREAGKKKKHLPIRKLIRVIPNLLTALKPCIMVSPLSASQFLDPLHIRFDLVIFDEASQICSEDAVGAIYRGKQLVVCGDNKQLPPTAFFDRDSSDDGGEEDSEHDIPVFDSILDECIALGMPQSWLRWHYRSKHESLIAFSNHRFYSDRLVVFPSAFREHDQLGVKFEHVPDGIYDRGGKTDNPREAEVIARKVLDHWHRFPNRSIGVIAFSKAQQETIEDKIELLLKDHPELEGQYLAGGLEKFFVKNLETAQGDERDVIIFSVGYGRDKDGKLTMSFGPLNKQGGERRLNVAVTRAREQVFIVSSIRAADMDLSSTKSAGVLSLYGYLDFAERGMAALELSHPQGNGEYDSPLEKDIAGCIRSMGFNAVPQVGCAGFRIDLGVISPDSPGRFVLGVECDGAMYHSSSTARDRDRMRQQVLESKGWAIHRIWSPDWVNHRAREIARLAEAIERSRQNHSSTPNLGNEATTTKASSYALKTTVRAEYLAVAEDVLPGWVWGYELTKFDIDAPSGFDISDPMVNDDLIKFVRQVIKTEAPVHIKILAKRIGDHWGNLRISQKRQEAIDGGIDLLCRQGYAERRGDFVYSLYKDAQIVVRYPDFDEPKSIRAVDLIAPEELALAVVKVVGDCLSIDKDALSRRVAGLFGFERTGLSITEAISDALADLVEAGSISIIENRIRILKECR